MNQIHNSDIADCLLKLVIYYNEQFVMDGDLAMGILYEVLEEGDISTEAIQDALDVAESNNDSLAMLICDTLLGMSTEARDLFVNETISAS